MPYCFIDIGWDNCATLSNALACFKTEGDIDSVTKQDMK